MFISFIHTPCAAWLDCFIYIYFDLDIHRTYYIDVCAFVAFCLQYAFSLFFALHKLLISLWKLHKCWRFLSFSMTVLVFHYICCCCCTCCCCLITIYAPTSHYIHISLISNLSRITKVNNLFVSLFHLPIVLGHIFNNCFVC